MNRAIFLIGMRGSGKTSLAEKIASYYPEKKHIDIDKEIVKEEEANISKIIATKGIRYFRYCEEQLLAKYQQSHDTIISTGGGVILSIKNRNLLKKEHSIFINVPLSCILRRLEKNPKKGFRPSLTKLSLKEELLYLWEERKLFYFTTAQYFFTNTFSLNCSAQLLYGCIQRKTLLSSTLLKRFP